MKLTRREKRKFLIGGLAMISLLLFAGLWFIGVVAPDALAALPLIWVAFGIVYSESNYLADVLLQEADNRASRNKVTVITGQNLLIGAIVGKITKALGAITADAGNTGDGTVTGASLGLKAKLGTYILNCIRTDSIITAEGDYLDSNAGLAMGTTKSNIATIAFDYHINGKEYQKPAVTAGTALSGDNLPTAKSGAWALDIGTNKTIDIVPAPDNVTGYADAATALAALPAVAADHVRLGTVTVDNTSGADFIPGTTLLDAAGIADTYADAAFGIADSGAFEVIDPDGNALPVADVGVAYANAHLNFTINDGAADFVIGDKFTIVVGAGSEKVTELAPAAVDGSQNAYGILTSAIDASAADVDGVAVVRDAVLKSSGIVWPAGITDAQKAAALAELETKLVTTREGV